jgi:hypothetical protein
MISDGASQAPGRFARKPWLLARMGDTKVLTDAKGVNCVVVVGSVRTAWRRDRIPIPWPEYGEVLSTLAGAKMDVF